MQMPIGTYKVVKIKRLTAQDKMIAVAFTVIIAGTVVSGIIGAIVATIAIAHTAVMYGLFIK